MLVATMRRIAAVAVVLTLSSLHPALAQLSYSQRNLISDDISVNPAAVQDPNLVNAWGISSSPTSPFWVSSAGAGVATLYNTAGQIVPLVVTVPSPVGGTASPTGQVFNGSNDFQVGANQPARFIFATEQGAIAGWNPQANGTNAILKVDNSAGGAVYKGLALANNGVGNFLYAANFGNNRIDVFDANYSAATLTGSFTDPNAVAGYAPFNIQALGGQLYVAYAKTQPGSIDEVAGAGFGYVDIFDTSGSFIRRLASGTDAGGSLTDLNAPWGLAIAPAHFGSFSNDILVGNFGNGEILALNPVTGALAGIMRDNTNTNPLVIDGLWALQVGNGGNGGDANKVYFSAGPNDEAHGLFGVLATSAPEADTLPLLVMGLPLLGVTVLARRLRQQ